MRKTFVDFAVTLAKQNRDVIIMSDDYGYGAFKNVPAGQFYNFPPTEQSIIGIAAGMAISGKLPIVYGMTPFMLERCFEQLKVDIDYDALKVVIVTYSDYDHDGITHVEINAPAMINLLHNFNYYAPLTHNDCYNALVSAYESPKPSFIKLTNKYLNSVTVNEATVRLTEQP